MKNLCESVPLVGGAMLAFILFVGLWKSFNFNGGQAGTTFMQASMHQAEKANKNLPSLPSSPAASYVTVEDLLRNASIPHEYSLGRRPMPNWDTERQLWLAEHPDKKNYTNLGEPRLFMLTGSQPQPCRGYKGDYLVLRAFKNKVDYCRLHDVQIFFNSAILDKNMDSFWSKLPLVRASMEAHPEAEWFWWVDSDLVITDMLFELPLHTYGQYNLVLHGWETEVFEKRSVMGLNAGSFLIRNCGWSMRFMDRWASMGPKGPIRDLAGRLQSALLPNRPPDYPGDDQAALIYFMIREHHLWGDKILLERSYNLNGYWLDMVGDMESIDAMERGDKSATNVESNKAHLSRSFVTHFTGCQPCSGNRNPAYTKHQCEHEMERALNLADNQVLLSMGFRHPNLNSLDVERLP
eukprot:c24916_g1_i1 orf=317-1540(+)